MRAKEWEQPTKHERTPGDLRLDDGSRVAVVGGGPAGSLFTCFLLDMARTVGINLLVDIFEPRDFANPGPRGCNMCGGIVSETLVQNLATEGINLPPTVVQRGIDSYVLHLDVGSVRIETPLSEMRIGAVIRGSGPRDIKERKWDSFDAHLLSLAQERGGRVVRDRVGGVAMGNGRPRLTTKSGESHTYDLVLVAIGVNSPTLKLFESLGIGYQRPKTTKTLIREYYLGEDVIGRTLGPSMHVFLPNVPGLEFAAMIPKGDYVTMCLLGEGIDRSTVDAFVELPEVKECMPPDWHPDQRSCQCMPRINVTGVEKPYADRILFIGDCGISRLYKDGIGAAYRTAKAAARTTLFEGISEAVLRRHYLPACRRIARDNLVGKLTFFVTRQIQKRRFARRALLQMTVSEQSKEGRHRRMSGVLWDMFTGSASYRDVFLRTLHPGFLGRISWHLLGTLLPIKRKQPTEEAR